MVAATSTPCGASAATEKSTKKLRHTVSHAMLCCLLTVCRTLAMRMFASASKSTPELVDRKDRGDVRVSSMTLRSSVLFCIRNRTISEVSLFFASVLYFFISFSRKLFGWCRSWLVSSAFRSLYASTAHSFQLNIGQYRACDTLSINLIVLVSVLSSSPSTSLSATSRSFFSISLSLLSRQIRKPITPPRSRMTGRQEKNAHLYSFP
mmetsp:Transcript_35606/g.60017  ORF Transcript_35606/g.60017 Transcript_35606/m.60017 type:complete len:207 (+) Transcript_35606:20-640(+)